MLLSFVSDGQSYRESEPALWCEYSLSTTVIVTFLAPYNYLAISACSNVCVCVVCVCRVCVVCVCVWVCMWVCVSVCVVWFSVCVVCLCGVVCVCVWCVCVWACCVCVCGCMCGVCVCGRVFR
jgi:hypothetical protein